MLPLKLAIIGSGPSGFYAAHRLLSLSSSSALRVHVFEKLPCPTGLVRYGVAPDHETVKNCAHKFDALAKDARFSFFGNVQVGGRREGKDGEGSGDATLLPLRSLFDHYNTVLFSYGTCLAPPLGVPCDKEALQGITQSLPFVSWYTSHPTLAPPSTSSSSSPLTPTAAPTPPPPFPLTGPKATLIGQGNVSLDIARILLKPPSLFSSSEMSCPLIRSLTEYNRISEVEIVGRRGPGEVSFTIKEFREVLSLPGVVYEGVRGVEMDQAIERAKREESQGGGRGRGRLLALMRDGVRPARQVQSSSSSPPSPNSSSSSNSDPTPPKKTLKLSFLKSPLRYLASPTHPSQIGSIEWGVNTLVFPPSPSPVAVAGLQSESGNTENEGVDSARTGSQPWSGPTPTPTPSPSQGAGAGARARGPVARPTGRTEKSLTDLVIESVGFRGGSITTPSSQRVGGLEGRKGDEGVEEWELPFDSDRGRIRNIDGRVVGVDGVMIPGMYTSGWIASGPVGVIASTMNGAYETARLILHDHLDLSSSTAAEETQQGTQPASTPTSTSTATSTSTLILNPTPDLDSLPEELLDPSRKIVHMSDWVRIDEEEKKRGRERGKSREKFGTVAEMLRFLG